MGRFLQHIGNLRDSTVYAAVVSGRCTVLSVILLCGFAGCVSHHTLHLDSGTAPPKFPNASFKIIEGSTLKKDDPLFESGLANEQELKKLLGRVLEQSGFQESPINASPDFFVSISPDYLPPGSQPPPLPTQPRLPNAQIIVEASELESIDPSKKEFWRLVLEVYDPLTLDVTWSAYAETSNGNHFARPVNRRNAIEDLVEKLRR